MTQRKMISKQFSLFFVGVIALLFAVSAVSAVTIFSDDFNDGDLAGWTVTNSPATLPGNAWTNVGSFAEAAPGSNGALGSSTLERTVSASGFNTIIVKYDRQLIGFDLEEEFKVLWSIDGTNFSTLEETLNTTPNDVSFVSQTFNLPVSANGANLILRFECTSNAQSDACRIDNFFVDGTSGSGSTTPTEVNACSAIGNPGQLNVKKIDFSNNGMDIRTFGSDDEWFPLEEIEVDLEIENDGNDDVDDISVEWGLWDTQNGEWVIDLDEEDEINLNDGDEETMTVSFVIDDDLDVDLDELSDGNHYRLYVIATGTVDSQTSPDTCVSDFESATIVLENDFVVLTNIQVPETLQCGETVQVTADVWNIGDSDQDEVSVQVFGREAALGVSETIEVGDIDAFDRQPLSFTFNVPRNLVDKTYALEFEVLDEDGDVFQNDFDDDESTFTVPLSVQGCAGGSSGNGTGSGAISVSASLVSGGKAGDDLVVKATITSNENELKTYTVSAAGFSEWADSVSLDRTTLVLNEGQSADVVFTIDVKDDATGSHTFFIEAVSGSDVTRQPVSVDIEPRSGFGITGNTILGEGWAIWVIGFLNVLLVVVIIIVAVRIARKK